MKLQLTKILPAVLLYNGSAFSQTINPPLAVPCYIAGSPTTAGSNGANDPAIVSLPNESSGQNPTETVLARGSQVGATWGLAYAPTSKKLYATSVLKRHAGFGPAGIGGIYEINVTNMAAPVVSTFLTRTDVGADPHGVLPASKVADSTDAGSFPEIGKRSFGDIDISPDEKTLYTVNLASRTLLAIDVATKAVTSYPITWSGATNSSNQIVKAVNVGGPALPSRNGGPAFTALNSLTTQIWTNNNVYNQWTKAPDVMFDTGYSGANVAVGQVALSFTDTVPNGDYEVTLYLVEPNDTGIVRGSRLADVRLEGAVVQTNLDIFAEAGRRDVPLEKKYTVTVSDGAMNLQFVRKSTDYRPILSGYKIRSLSTAPASAPADVRPWAVKTHGDDVYVGVVSSAETSGLAEDLKGAVLKLNKATGTFTEHFPVDLNYIKGLHWYGNDARGWYPWISDWTQIPANHTLAATGETLIQHPQAILSDIEILPDGTFVLGLNDRFGFQSGQEQDNPSGLGNFSGQAAGDTIRFCLVSGSYVQEGKPGCTAGMTAFDGSERHVPASATVANPITANVPAGKEYFQDAFNLTSTIVVHPETSWGGLTTVLGTGGVLELAVATLDPYDTVSGGIRWYQPMSSGAVTRRAQIYRTATLNGTFAKAVGLGDLEALNAPIPLSVGNLVFKDLDNDGVFEPGAGETGINGVTVQICSAGADGAIGGGDDVEINVGADGVRGTADDAAGGMVTANGGCYYFSNLLPGKYFIKIPASQFNPASVTAALKGLASSTGNQGDNGADDTLGENGIDPTTLTGLATSGITSTVIDLAIDSEVTGEPGACNTLDDADDNNGDLTVDFGFWQPLCIGNLVFIDSNADGLLTSENGLSGATVQLFNSAGAPATNYLGQPIASVLTGGSGQYLFCDLAPGDYKVRVTPPARYVPTTLAGTPDPDPNPADNDSNGSSIPGQPYVESTLVTLLPGTEPVNDDDEFNYTNTTVDFGFISTVGVGNLVFRDNNGNSAYDAGDVPVGGVTVQLFAQGANPLTATPLATTTTATSGPNTGCYLFDGLLPGNFFVFIPPTQFATGGPLEDTFSTPGVDSAALGDDNFSENGIDSATPATTGIASSSFALNNDSEPVGETGACNTQDDADDNNIRLTVDFGFVEPVCLGNLIFLDPNNNGLQDDAVVLTGATVQAFRVINGILEPATTVSGSTVASQLSATGLYEFCNLPPGDYVVRVTPPAGVVPSPFGGDPDNNTPNDSNGSPVGGQLYVQSPPVTLIANTEPMGEAAPSTGDDDNSNNTVDFGFVPGAIATPVGLGDRVWCDENANGQQDSGEPGASGVVVTLTVGSNVITTTTDGSGLYSFASNSNAAFLAANVGQTAVISVDKNSPNLNGCNLTTTPNTGDETSDSDGVPNGSFPNIIQITTVVPPLGTIDNTNDFGFTPAVCIGNLVFLDLDRDGSSVGEQGLAGATVSLYYADGTTVAKDLNGVTLAPIVTGSTGKYLFCNLIPGEYVVKVQPPLPVTGTPGPGYVPTTAAATVDPDANPTDTDSNNTPAGTPASPNQVASTPVTLTVAAEPVGDEDNDDNTNQTVDFGFYPQVGVGNLVWKDNNGNSIFDAGDAPVKDVVVQVWPEGATTSGVSPYQSMTDASGHWLVTNAPPGRYFAFIPPSQFQVGGALAGCRSTPGVEEQPTGSAPDDNLGENGIDDIAPQTNGIRTRNFNLRVDTEPFVTFGETGDGLNTDAGPLYDDDSIDLTKDFAFFAPASITGSIFEDTDNNNSGNVKIPVVTLTLCRDLNGDGDANDLGEGPADNPNTTVADVYTITTTAGDYAFTGLAPGGYVVKETQPLSYLNVGNLDAAADTAGSPPDSAINSPLDEIPVVLVSGETDAGNDFVEERPVAIGNLVFTDLDNDGKFEPASGETGIDGAAIELWSPGLNGAVGGGDDTLLSSTTTADGGCYLFSGLAPGSYFIKVPAADFDPTARLAGMSSSTGQDSADSTDDTVNENGDDNLVDGVTSAVVALALNSEPINEPGKDGSTNSTNLAADADTNLTVDFGFYTLASICGENFVDLSGDGSGDTSVNTTVALFNDTNNDGLADGATDDPNLSGTQAYTITTVDGSYCFTNLPPGSYVVVQSQPVGYNTVTDLDSKTDSPTSTPDQPNGSTTDNRIAVTVVSGESDEGNDFIEAQQKPTAFASWQAQNALGGQNSAVQNPDGDRYSNLAEYAFCLPPNSGSNSPLCLVQTGVSAGNLTYIRAKGLTDVTFTVQTTAALAAPTVWATLGGSPVITDNGNGTETVTYPNVVTAATANGASAFYRVCVTLTATSEVTYTEIQGYVRHNIVSGCETYACPLLPRAVVSGNITSVTGQMLDVATSLGSTDLSGLLQPGQSYYMEITSGENEGQRFDIDAAGASTIILSTDADLCSAEAPYNTLVGAAPATLAGDSFVLYPHRTIAQLAPIADYQSGNSPATADRILVKRGGAWDIYWLYTNGAGPAYWDLDGDGTFADAGADVLPPSQGLFVHKVSADTETLACIGEVRIWDFCAPLCEADGCTLLAPGYPVDQCPEDLKMLLADGWNGDADPTLADKFIIWNGDSGADRGYLCYWLADSAPYQYWTLDGDVTLPNKDQSKVILRSRSTFLQPQTAKPTWCQPAPFTP